MFSVRWRATVAEHELALGMLVGQFIGEGEADVVRRNFTTLGARKAVRSAKHNFNTSIRMRPTSDGFF